MADPRVSFMIPTRNHAQFIRTCIDSCLAQQLPSYEIVVMDGASTDNTVEVLKSYGDKLRFVSEKDSGQSDAINKGIKAARGEIIAWINSDDYYPNGDVLRRVLAKFDEAPDVDIVYGHGMMVDIEHKPLKRFEAYQINALKEMAIHGRCFVAQPAVFFKRQLFLDVGGVAEGLHLAMDYDLWMRLFPAARSRRFLDEDLACIVSHQDAKSVHSVWKQIREMHRIKRRYIPKLGLDAKDWVKLAMGEAVIYTYGIAVRTGLWKVT
ncbi:MAG TPA: glycosyltransferase family 2 protein [Kofleriaceae bacterium]|nr:glycosyltransferase family 2 protein [Kofleriaceae bacterium]